MIKFSGDINLIDSQFSSKEPSPVPSIIILTIIGANSSGFNIYFLSDSFEDESFGDSSPFFTWLMGRLPSTNEQFIWYISSVTRLPLTSFLTLAPSKGLFIPTPLESKTYFFTPPCTSARIGVPDLSLPPVIFIFPASTPIIEESRMSPTLEPSNGCAEISLISLETLFPVGSEITNLKCANIRYHPFYKIFQLVIKSS